MISAHQSEMVELQHRYAEKNREVKRRVRQDERTYIEGKAEEAELAARKGDSRMLYKITKELSGNTRCHPKPVKNANGETITDKDGHLASWAERFACILNKEAPRNPPRLTPNPIELPTNTDEPTNEIRMAIKELKNNKAAGSDNVAAELLKADITTTTDMLYPLFKEIWKTERIPLDWQEVLIVKLPKKGDTADCNNWLESPYCEQCPRCSHAFF